MRADAVLFRLSILFSFSRPSRSWSMLLMCSMFWLSYVAPRPSPPHPSLLSHNTPTTHALTLCVRPLLSLNYHSIDYLAVGGAHAVRLTHQPTYPYPTTYPPTYPPPTAGGEGRLVCKGERPPEEVAGLVSEGRWVGHAGRRQRSGGPRCRA